MNNISGETFLLTGATGGIGAELACCLQKLGATLLIQGRSQEKLTQLKARLGDPKDIILLAGDLTRESDIQHIVEAALAHGVNGLINIAGINEFGLFENANIEQVINLNVIATMRLTQALLPAFKSRNAGCIVNVGSTFGVIGFPGYATYCASKHAIAGFTQALKRELADSGIQVLYVAPRATDTDMNNANTVAMNAKLGVTMDSPARVAAAIVDSIVKTRSRYQLGWQERLQSKLNTLLPGIVDSALAKQLPVIKKYISP
jgi:short-subunit dehydrogenase